MTSSGSDEAAGAADVGNGGTGRAGGSGKARWVRRMMREPLLQFMLMGAVIFAAHAAVTPSVSKERLIEVTPEVRQSIIDVFKSAHEGREPAQDELAKLTDLWVLNEITFREALAQGLDKGDEMIRDRIVLKMRLLIFDSIQVEEPTRQQLAEWYEKRRANYDIPDLVSFIEVPFDGPEAEVESRKVQEQILSGTESDDVRLRSYVFAQRPRQTLVPSYGRDFVDRLVALPAGEWKVLPSASGWHVVRLDTFTPGRKVDLDEVGSQAAQAWKDERRRVLGIAATRELGKAYVIRRGEP